MSFTGFFDSESSYAANNTLRIDYLKIDSQNLKFLTTQHAA